MVEVFLSVGSNDSERQRRVESALAWLRERLADVAESHIYATAPLWGAKGAYVNAVMRGSVADVAALERDLKAYEIANGRDAAARAEGRVPIDIDIVVADGKVVRPCDYGADFFRLGFETIARQ